MTGRFRTAALLAAHILCTSVMGVFAAPALAMQILDAADHAELAAEISAREVSRIALSGDRIAKVVRSPDGFAVEHDPRSGDLYLRPVHFEGAGGDPVTLFVGTERGFTYRLALTPADRGSAQILIRNAKAAPAAVSAPDAGDPRIAALVRLVRAVARREPLPGHELHAGSGAMPPGLRLVETWRGPRFRALVIEAGPDAPDAAGLAGTMAGSVGTARVAALWLAAPGTGPTGGRLAVAVVEPASGHAQAGDVR